MVRAILVTLVGTVLLLLALLWREHQHARDLQARVREIEMRLARAIDAAPKKTPLAPVTTKVENAAVTATPASISPSASPAPRTFSDAERGFRKGVDEQRRWTVLAKKAELLAAMNLPGDKSATLKDLLVERDYAEKDARDAARKAGLQPHEAAAAEVAKIDARIQAVLGDSDYARYAEQMSITVFRDQLDGSPIPGSLIDAGAPLAPNQMAWIAGVMYRSFGAQLTDQPSQSPDPDAARRAFATTLLAEAPGKLTPPQIAALSEYFRKDDELAGHVKALIREQSQRK
jgi:hypothetical protein